MDNVLMAFLLTAIAGLSTGIGSVIAFFAKNKNTTFLSVSLGLSAGVMIYVSFVELFPTASEMISAVHGASKGNLLTVAGFFGGMLLIFIIDRLIPEDKNPHEVHDTECLNCPDQGIGTTDKKNKSLMRTGIMTAFAIALHNFPEGMATFISALQEPTLAIPIVIAIAIHNIPEGIAVSVPIYYATGSKKRAFVYSILSGLSELLGAVIGYLILMPFLNETVYGLIFAAVAGIMVFISFDELLPLAREHGEHHHSIYGLVAGMLIMAISLILFM